MSPHQRTTDARIDNREDQRQAHLLLPNDCGEGILPRGRGCSHCIASVADQPFPCPAVFIYYFEAILVTNIGSASATLGDRALLRAIPASFSG